MSSPVPCAVNVFIDSDGVVADFDKALAESGLTADKFKYLPGVYLWLDVIHSARESIETLKKLDDADKIKVWILTKTPSGSPYAYTEKVLWYRKHFPWLEDRVIITHDKHLMGTASDFLLDDRPHKANVQHFRGEFWLFNTADKSGSWSRFTHAIVTNVS